MTGPRGAPSKSQVPGFGNAGLISWQIGAVPAS
jgi:hypothetical protein